MLIPLKQDGLLLLRGTNAQTFIQGQSTCDVMATGEHRIAYGACCTPKGRVVNTFMLVALSAEHITDAAQGGDDGNTQTEPLLLMRMPAETVPIAQNFLTRYAMLSRVAVEDAREQWRGFGLYGTDSLDCARQLWGDIPQVLGEYRCYDGLVVVRRDKERLECWCTQEHWHAHYTALHAKLEEAQHTLWTLCEIRSGLGTVYPATKEQFLPQMLNLEAWGGISYTKGCYTGQEVVARAHHLGQLKRVLVHATGTGNAPAVGDTVYDANSKRCGDVVCLAPNNETDAAHGAYELLAVVREQASEGVLYASPEHASESSAIKVLKRFDAPEAS